MTRVWSPIALVATPADPTHPTALRLTAHAVQRYHERWRPQWEHPDAARELTLEARGAVFVERDGQALVYRTPKGALLSVAEDGTVMTVLPQGAAKTIWRPQKPPRKRKPVSERKGAGRDDRMTKSRGRQQADKVAVRIAQDVLDWNRDHPPGTPVMVRGPLSDNLYLTHTRSTAWVQCDHASVLVDGFESAMDLTHVRPATAEELLHAASQESAT